jgi:hypothetical protein
LTGKPVVNIPELENMIPLHWTDQTTLYVSKKADVPVAVYKFDLNTKKLEFWKEFAPPDPTGVQSVGPIVLAPSASSYAFSYRSVLSDLYLITGLQ